MVRSTLKRLARRVVSRSPRIPAERPQQARPAPTPLRVVEPEPEVDVEPSVLQEWFDAGRDPVILDIRERHELLSGTAEGAWLVPLNQVPAWLSALPRDRPVVVACAIGGRSYGVARYLREQGLDDAWSLAGGVPSWLATGAPSEQPPASLTLPRVPEQLAMVAK